MNTPVSFPLAKLLKEKGFDEPCKLCVEDGDERPLPFDCGNTIHRNSLHPYYSAPSISEVVMWVYEKHGIWINIYYKPKYKSWDYEYTNINWSQEEVDKKLKEDIDNLLEDIFNSKIKYNSPTEAYEAAIEYVLTKLI